MSVTAEMGSCTYASIAVTYRGRTTMLAAGEKRNVAYYIQDDWERIGGMETVAVHAGFPSI